MKLYTKIRENASLSKFYNTNPKNTKYTALS